MRAVALIRSFVFVLSRDRFHDMEKNHPKLLFMLQQVLLKSLAMTGENPGTLSRRLGFGFYDVVVVNNGPGAISGTISVTLDRL